MQSDCVMIQSMNISHDACQFNSVAASGAPVGGVASVFFWWFAYGFYFSQRSGHA